MEYNHKEYEAEIPRQNVSGISQKNLSLKIRINLTNDEKRGLRELQKDGKFRVYKFYKGRYR